MQVLNKSTWKRKPYTVFITSYSGLYYFIEWSLKLRNSDVLQLVVVDTGNQEIAREITDIPVFQLSENVGCAGSWNTCTNLGFNYYGLDKLMIGQDDAIFTVPMVEAIWQQTSDDMLVGAYDRGFTYSLFGLTKGFWKDVGMFDENFIYATYEDNDYIHRLKISGKQWKSLNYSADLNCNITSAHLGDDVRSVNKEYMIEKWGHFEGVYEHPFNNPNMKVDEFIIHQNLIDVYGNVNKFPSIAEFEQFMAEV